MIVTEFSETCKLYKDFHVWEIDSIDSFFKGNEILATIFQDTYKIVIDDFIEKRKNINDSDFEIMKNLLGKVGDKEFFPFTLHDENHMELIGMQKMNIMNFGMNIEEIKPDHFYVMIMDKIK